MPRYNQDLIVALLNQVSLYPSLKSLNDKYSLTLYNVFTPTLIAAIDSEIHANPYILSESIGFLETASHLSMFYSHEGDHDFVEDCKSKVIALRTQWYTVNNRVLTQHNEPQLDSLQKELMEEYFISSDQEFRYFLNHNPFYMGIYLYVLVTTLSME